MAALGLRCRLPFWCNNPCDIVVTVGNVGPVTPIVQCVLNGAIISEVAGIGSVTLPCVRGMNILQLCVADGAIFLSGKLLSALSPSVSMYPAGSEPFGFAQVGSTNGSTGSSQGPSISSAIPPA